MATEIELKFIAGESAIAALPDFLSKWPNVYEGKQTLSNTYYETDDNFLRKRRMGLRIRSFDGKYEMTLKTEGNVIAGLHQRPEYNVSLSEPALSLALLPEDIWPQNCDLVELQSHLKPLFSTDFIREKWLVTYESSEIELALDRGDIKAEALSEPLNEIELELKQGEVSDVLAFAQRLSELGGLRLGSQSKAARGYRLSQPQALPKIKAFSIVSTAPKSTVEQALTQTIEAALSYWQYHEDLWLAGEGNARSSVIEAITVIRQIWVIWGGMIPRKATATLRERLQQIEEVLEEKNNDAQRVCYQPDYVQAKLALTQWIVDKQWLTLVDKKGLAKLNSSFKRFADIMLSRSAKLLKDAFSSELAEQEFKDRQPLLHRQIISFQLLAGAYSVEAVNLYLKPWRDLLTAIAEDQGVDKLRLAKKAVEQPVFWLNSSQ